MGRRPDIHAKPKDVTSLDFAKINKLRFPGRCPYCPPPGSKPVETTRNPFVCSAALTLECDLAKLAAGKQVGEFSFRGAPSFEPPWELGSLRASDGYHVNLVPREGGETPSLRLAGAMKLRGAIGNAGSRHFIHGYEDGGIGGQRRAVEALAGTRGIPTCAHSGCQGKIRDELPLSSLVLIPHWKTEGRDPGIRSAISSSPACGNSFFFFHVVRMMFESRKLREERNLSEWLYGVFAASDKAIPADGIIKAGGSLDERFSGSVPGHLELARALTSRWEGFFAAFGEGGDGWGLYRDCFRLSAFENASPIVKTPPATWNAEVLTRFVDETARAKTARDADIMGLAGGKDAAATTLTGLWV